MIPGRALTERTLASTVIAGLAVVLIRPDILHAAGSLAESGLEWPTWAELLRVLSLRDYNTRVVIIGATLLGLAAGLVGTFLLLRKRALLSDALSHATLPGIALAFILMSMAGGEGKHLLGLLAGAAVFSVLGTLTVMAIRRWSRLKDDAALGISLSVYFGMGIALMGIATRMETGNAAGLNAFIYGKTASMLYADALLIALTALGAAVFCLAFFKEFGLICFDAEYAAARGWPVARLDFLLMTLVVIVTVIGLQAVGLILVVALLIIPPSSARFWTRRLSAMLWLSGLFGALSGLLGAALSALMANLPAGAVIVLTAAFFFILSLFFGADRGLIRITAERRRLAAKIARENLLRTLYEMDEAAAGPEGRPEPNPHPFDALLADRSWSRRRLRRTLRRLMSEGAVQPQPVDRFRLTGSGARTAADVVRKHRLWEAYLIAHADVAAAQVDIGADRIEHVLDREMIRELEALLPRYAGTGAPGSPHPIEYA
jgi:manganese/zinc/iron transport system permease protein